MPKARKYYTLISKYSQPGGTWAAEFGDYSRGIVQGEKREYEYNSELAGKMMEYKIIETGDKQAEINAAIAELNS